MLQEGIHRVNSSLSPPMHTQDIEIATGTANGELKLTWEILAGTVALVLHDPYRTGEVEMKGNPRTHCPRMPLACISSTAVLVVVNRPS